MTANKNQITIGIDLGDRRHAFCVLDNRGQIVAEESVPNTRAGLEQLSQRHRGATIAMETGTHSPWVSRLFETRGHTVYVANARKVRAISQSVTKTDEQDARMLARLRLRACRVFVRAGSCECGHRRHSSPLRRNP